MMTDKNYKKTLEYYNSFTNDYVARTATTDEVMPFYESVLPLLKPGSKILDFGCGTGRDSLFFMGKGFDVVAYDGSGAMCEIAKKSGIKKVINRTFLELDSNDEFDLVWAYASLLHSATQDLSNIFNKVYKVLKPDGKFFICFKYGNFEGIRNDRLFNDFTEEKFDTLLSKSKFVPYKIWVTDDVRTKQNRSDKWLNAVLEKANKLAK